ncbi:MAG: aminotransferase class V-fold PLP-dependent enzyme [Nanoarchaeota archaeon]|nr:aminotransferase class V-fold PLP-dependent enzyme [Nanoarchaeota archaeon]
MNLPNTEINNLRRKFPSLNKEYNGKQLIYFDNACSLLKPESVIKAVNYYYSDLGSCAGTRSSHALSSKVNELCENARELTKDFINASLPSEIIWTKNTTESINFIANSLNFNKNDEIITTSHEHHSNLLPFYFLKQKGVKLKIIDVVFEDDKYLDDIKESITKNTKLITLTHASNVTGDILDIENVCKTAHDNNILVLSDEAQFIVHDKLDVKKTNVDFCAFSSTKLGGPTGLGILHVKHNLLDEIKPLSYGGGIVFDVGYKNGSINPIFLKPPQKFEAGLQHYAGIIGFGEAIKFYNENKIYEFSEYCSYILKHTYKSLSDLNIKILGEKTSRKKSPIVSFELPKNVSHKDFEMFINENKDYIFAFRTGTHCASPLHYRNQVNISKGEGSVRLSFFVYNQKQEIDLFIEQLNNFLEKIR